MLARTLSLVALLATPMVTWSQEAIPLPPVARSPEKLIRVIYPVAELIVPIRGLDCPIDATRAESNKTKEDWLIRKVTATVAPKTWGRQAIIEYSASDMTLMVTQTPEVHGQIARMFATMLSIQDINVVLETRAAKVNRLNLRELHKLYPRLKDAGQIVLSDIDLFTLLEANEGNPGFQLVQVSKTTLAPGQRAQFRFSKDIDARYCARVACSFEHVEVDIEAEAFDVKFKKKARVPDGGTLVFTERKDSDTHVLFMVTARVIIETEPTQIDVEKGASKSLPGGESSHSLNGIIQTGATAIPPHPMAMDPEAHPLQKASATKKSSPKPVKLKISVCEGDPLGSREAGNLRILAEPTLQVLENEVATFHAGGQVPALIAAGSSEEARFLPFGITVRAKPGTIKDGRLPLELTIESSTLAEQSEDRLITNIWHAETKSTATLGQVARFRVGRASEEKQMWFELIAEEVTASED